LVVAALAQIASHELRWVYGRGKARLRLVKAARWSVLLIRTAITHISPRLS
jgi:hypothetical protein